MLIVYIFAQQSELLVNSLPADDDVDNDVDNDDDDETESCFQLSIGWQSAKTFYSIVPGAQANSWLPSDNRM